MAGAIIENMSTKKLCIVGGILLIFQVIAFLVGGLIAPGPTTAVSYMSVKCVDSKKVHHKSKWFMPWGPNHCDKIRDFDEAPPRQIEANDIVFAVHVPLPSMEMSPWFQFMLFILQLDIAFKLNNQISDSARLWNHLLNGWKMADSLGGPSGSTSILSWQVAALCPYSGSHLTPIAPGLEICPLGSRLPSQTGSAWRAGTLHGIQHNGSIWSAPCQTHCVCALEDCLVESEALLP
uniref:Wnt ligand secretion mediator n=1 Tax=Vombatus ursinus TaxID=29139 RepID=A0A4X2L5T8_VOMUR